MPSSLRGVFRLSGSPVAFHTALDSRSFLGVFGPPTAGTTLRLTLTWFLAKFVSSVPDMSRPRFSIVLRRSSALRTRTIACLWRGMIGRPLFWASLRASLSWNRRRRICFAISRISCSVSSMLSGGGSTSGLFANSGLMLSNSFACSSIEWPHCSDTSITYMMQARRWAIAVMACISITLRSSSGWSRMPGVSITCQRRYL
uniref:Uncharacterized protein n=1 Tax=Anopheles coluzzii TaxID=1518534 RepID=A0A8W7PG81_ANOCL